MRVAVAGGTGIVGSHVVSALTRDGHTPVVLARSRGVDLTSGQGLGAALAGADAVVDTSNVTTTSRRRSVEFFTRATSNLVDQAGRAGVQHLVVLSIVGIDRVDFGYYEGKRRQEELVRDAAMPHTILRATQFHEFAQQLLDRVPGPVAVVPRMRSQPIAATEVAGELVRLAAGPALGDAPELAGPEVHDMAELVRRQARRNGSRRPVLAVRLPGGVGRAMAGGALLPSGPGPRGSITFDDWLAGS